MGVSIMEQETTISLSRTDSSADIWTSDTMMMTKLDRLCEEAPENYKCIEEGRLIVPPGSKAEPEIASKRYRISDKKLLSFRSKRVVRELTDEQREALRERMKAISANNRK